VIGSVEYPDKFGGILGAEKLMVGHNIYKRFTLYDTTFGAGDKDGVLHEIINAANQIWGEELACSAIHLTKIFQVDGENHAR